MYDSGVAIGGGWQALVAYINLFCYYMIGLPLGFYLGYRTSLGVEVKSHILYRWWFSLRVKYQVAT